MDGEGKLLESTRLALHRATPYARCTRQQALAHGAPPAASRREPALYCRMQCPRSGRPLGPQAAPSALCRARARCGFSCLARSVTCFLPLPFPRAGLIEASSGCHLRVCSVHGVLAAMRASQSLPARAPPIQALQTAWAARPPPVSLGWIRLGLQLHRRHICTANKLDASMGQCA